MHSRDDILNLIRDKVHHPANARELAQLLRVPREERSSFKRQLKALVSEGMLLQIRGNRFGLAEKMDLVVGRLQTNSGGYGFVVPEHPARGRPTGLRAGRSKKLRVRRRQEARRLHRRGTPDGRDARRPRRGKNRAPH